MIKLPQNFRHGIILGLQTTWVEASGSQFAPEELNQNGKRVWVIQTRVRSRASLIVLAGQILDERIEVLDVANGTAMKRQIFDFMIPFK